MKQSFILAAVMAVSVTYATKLTNEVESEAENWNGYNSTPSYGGSYGGYSTGTQSNPWAKSSSTGYGGQTSGYNTGYST